MKARGASAAPPEVSLSLGPRRKEKANTIFRRRRFFCYFLASRTRPSCPALICLFQPIGFALFFTLVIRTHGSRKKHLFFLSSKK